MISEEALCDLLTEAAGAWPVPPDGPASVRRAAAGATRPPVARAVRPRLALARRRGPLLGAAAAVVLVLASVAAAVALGGGPSSSRPRAVVSGSNAGVAAAAPQHASAGAARGAPAAPGSSAVPDVAGQRVVETASLALQVAPASVTATLARLGTLAVAEGGYVASSSSQRAGGSPSGVVALRVPVARFESAETTAAKYGKLLSEQGTGRDVTSTYVDLQARINALEIARSTYLAIEAKATTIGQVLAVQQQVDSVEAALEALQGQRRLLASQTSDASLTVTVAAPGRAARHRSGLVTAWHRAVAAFQHGVEDLVGALGPLLLVAICLALLAVLGRLGWRVVRRGLV